MISCQKWKRRGQLKSQAEQTESPSPQLRHKWRRRLHGSSFCTTGRLWSLANLMFPPYGHVVQRPLMAVKYNAKLLSYFNCKRGSTKGQTWSSNAPMGNVYIPIFFTSPGWHRAGRGQATGNVVHRNVPQILRCSVSDCSASVGLSER